MARKTEAVGAGCTISDSRFFPLVTNVTPLVSIATPTRWMCSSMYLQGEPGRRQVVTSGKINTS